MKKEKFIVTYSLYNGPHRKIGEFNTYDEATKYALERYNIVKLSESEFEILDVVNSISTILKADDKGIKIYPKIYREALRFA